MLIIGQVQKHLLKVILEKEKNAFYSNKKVEQPRLFQEDSQSRVFQYSTEIIFLTKKEESEEEVNPETPLSREDFLKSLQTMEGGEEGDHSLIEEIAQQWKELSSKIRHACRLDFKFEADKYRVGTHSFRYTSGKNEMAWNTALKFIFNNVKKLISLQERIQSLEIAEHF